MVFHRRGGTQDNLTGVHQPQKFLSQRPLEFPRFDSCDNGFGRDNLRGTKLQRFKNFAGVSPTPLNQLIPSHEKTYQIVGGLCRPLDAGSFLPDRGVHSVLDTGGQAILWQFLLEMSYYISPSVGK